MSRRFERLHEGARANRNLPTGLLYHCTVRTPDVPLVQSVSVSVKGNAVRALEFGGYVVKAVVKELAQ